MAVERKRRLQETQLMKLMIVLEGGKRFGRGGNSLVDVLDLLVTAGQEQEEKVWIDNQPDAEGEDSHANGEYGRTSR